ncbi:G- protein-coupled receptor [Steccherinum ochraceum]|uniref:G-protein-coupled receptor n=1 Tax=Steccherinum ochraceum TaxID=92696 RepID=A0A4R0RAQ8_9APHY|nr:G- protein-coupled receptor [Steccherinum ochraceum]
MHCLPPRLFGAFVLAFLTTLPVISAVEFGKSEHHISLAPPGLKPSTAPICALDRSLQVPAGYTNMGCFSDGPKRALTGYAWKGDKGLAVTPASCLGLSERKGFAMYGVEAGPNGLECYSESLIVLVLSYIRLSGDSFGVYVVGNSFENGQGYAIPSSYCPEVSLGEPAGGSWALSVYMPTLTLQSYVPANEGSNWLHSANCQPPKGWEFGAWTNMGCAQDGPARALTGYTFTSESMTPEVCIEACAGLGYSIAGVEVARECWCDNVFRNGLGGQLDASQCLQRTNDGGVGGGKWALSVYASTFLSKPYDNRPLLNSGLQKRARKEKTFGRKSSSPIKYRAL